MISSFFRKTKPINYLVLLFFILVFYLLNFFFTNSDDYSILWISIVLAAILLTNSSSFSMLFFVLLCMAIPKLIGYEEIVLCNLFLMLSINRLLALNTLKDVKQKIFDATLWISVASIFDPLALLFLIVVFLSIYVYGTKEFKNWLVPFVAGSIFLILLSTFLVITKNTIFLQNHYTIYLENSFAEGFYQNFSVKPFIYVIAILCLVSVVFIKQVYQSVGRIIHLRLILVYFLISVLIFIIRTPLNANYMTLLYSFFPAAVFGTNFLEILKKKRLKELVLVAGILFPFVLLILDFVKT